MNAPKISVPRDAWQVAFSDEEGSPSHMTAEAGGLTIEVFAPNRLMPNWGCIVSGMLDDWFEMPGIDPCGKSPENWKAAQDAAVATISKTLAYESKKT